MPDVGRSIYFYRVELAEGAGGWKRADVLRGLDALTGEDQVLTLGNDNYAWAIVDRIPQGNQSGRLRFFRDRRSNLPGWAQDFNLAELPIPEDAGLIDPTHLVLGGDVESPSRWRLAAALRHAQASSRHSRCVRLRLSTQPCSSSS